MKKATQSQLDHDLMVKAIRPPMGYDPVQAQSFDEMLANLVGQEEKHFTGVLKSTEVLLTDLAGQEEKHLQVNTV